MPTRLTVPEQLKTLTGISGSSFQENLKAPLVRRSVDTLQLNLGYLCNQECSHCHVDAGPRRKEMMSREIMQRCLDLIPDLGVKTVDLTGGAPEMNPDFQWLVRELHAMEVQTMVRSNLTILVEGRFKQMPEFFRDMGVKVISSLPCYTAENTDRQRGKGVFSKSIKALQRLNELGYGKSDGLQLDLVYNPGGAFLPGDQSALENDYKDRLLADHGISFDNLLCLTNLPISRFLDSLLDQGKLVEYLDLLRQNYNPDNEDGLMCRDTLSVGWDGRLYDCDFNQMLGLKTKVDRATIMEIKPNELIEAPIVTGGHCFGCTAGAGSSCQGQMI